jgi:protein TonB
MLPTVVAVPAPEPPAPAPRAAPSAAPRRPFFQPTDVNEAPRVATRVEPQLPEEVRSLAVDDVVILRLLVSETGQPSQVSVLRRSRVGRPLDDAVVAAVNQWTFAPARRRGEAVSSWYNVGVPVGRAVLR